MHRLVHVNYFLKWDKYFYQNFWCRKCTFCSTNMNTRKLDPLFFRFFANIFALLHGFSCLIQKGGKPSSWGCVIVMGSSFVYDTEWQILSSFTTYPRRLLSTFCDVQKGKGRLLRPHWAQATQPVLFHRYSVKFEKARSRERNWLSINSAEIGNGRYHWLFLANDEACSLLKITFHH